MAGARAIRDGWSQAVDEAGGVSRRDGRQLDAAGIAGVEEGEDVAAVPEGVSGRSQT